MRVRGYVESIDTLPPQGADQRGLKCIMIDGLPVMAPVDTPMSFSVGDEVDIAVRVSGKRLNLANGDGKVFRTFWFSALVWSSGAKPAVAVVPPPVHPEQEFYTNGGGATARSSVSA